MKKVKCLARLLLSIGGLSMGWAGLTGTDLMASCLGECCPMLHRGAQITVGVCAIITIAMSVMKRIKKSKEKK